MPLAAVISTVAFLAVVAGLLALYASWRLRQIDNDLYSVRWDVDALIDRLDKAEESETPEPSGH
jgi:hypothetical protein